MILFFDGIVCYVCFSLFLWIDDAIRKILALKQDLRVPPRK